MESEPVVYRGLSAAEVEFQYNFRARVPEHPAHIARWVAASEVARSRLAGERDVPYGPHPRQAYDLFSAGPSSPLLVFIHGGYWQALSKDHFSFIAEPYVRAGVSVALLGYALCPEVTIGTIIEQVADGMRALSRTATRVVASGHSAGGHLAAAMAARGLVDAAMGLSGIYELEPLRFCTMNAALRLGADEAQRWSPHHAVPDAPCPPLLLACGAAETPEVQRQQDDFAAAWKARGHRAATHTEADSDHFTVVDRFAAPESLLFCAMLRQIGSAA